MVRSTYRHIIADTWFVSCGSRGAAGAHFHAWLSFPMLEDSTRAIAAFAELITFCHFRPHLARHGSGVLTMNLDILQELGGTVSRGAQGSGAPVMQILTRNSEFDSKLS